MCHTAGRHSSTLAGGLGLEQQEESTLDLDSARIDEGTNTQGTRASCQREGLDRGVEELDTDVVMWEAM